MVRSQSDRPGLKSHQIPCELLGKSFDISEPQFPYLVKEDSNTYLDNVQRVIASTMLM